MKWDILKRKKHTKKDGWLSELISMNYKDEPFNEVHSYVVSFKPGTTRAMHYHKEKEEWITLGTGMIKVVVEDIINKEKETIILDGNDKEQKIIYLPPNVAHVIKNIGNESACVIAFSKTPEIPGDTIEYQMDV